MTKRYLAGLCLALFFCLLCGKLCAQTITVGPVSGTIRACAGSASVTPAIQQFKVTGTGLTGNVRVTAPTNFELTADPSIGYNPVHLLVPNGGTVNFTIYVRSAATAPVGGISGQVLLTSPGAADRSVMVGGTVDPLPTVNPVANQTVAHNGFTSAVNFTGTGQDYTWTNSDPTIGLPASGRGNIPLFKAINTTGGTQKATITVTPVPGSLAYTANNSSNTISIINTGTRAVQTIPVGTQPEKAMVSADGSRVYVSNAGSSFGNIKSNISLIDAYTGVELKRVDVPLSPQDIKLSPDGKYLYVASTGSNKLTVMDAKDLTILFETSITNNPNVMGMSPDGSRIYIASEGPPGRVTVFNTANNTVAATIMNISAPGDMAITPDSKLVYISDQYGNKVNVINATTNTVVAVIPVGSFPVSLGAHPDGTRVFVANTTSGTVSVINTANQQVIATIAADCFKGMTMSPDGSFIYAVGQNPQVVSVINTATNKVVATIPVSGAPGSPAVSPDGSRLFVPEQIGNTVYVINTINNTVDANLGVGSGPFIFNNSISSGFGCSGTPITFTISVEPPPPPVINHTGTPAGMNTTFGTASANTSFNVSASNLSTGVLVTPPAGYEVSTDNITYTSTVTLGSTGTLASTRVYIRLSATANATNYSGNVVLSSGVTTHNVSMPLSVINPAPLTVKAANINKTYGTALAAYTGTDRYTITAGSLKNGNTITAVTINYGTGAAANAAVRTYTGTATPGTIIGDNGFLASNYTVTPATGNITVDPAELTITANTIDKTYGTVLNSGAGSAAFTATGLQNGETIGNITVTYAAGASASDLVKLYIGSITPKSPTGGTFNISNYIVKTLVPGNINVVPALLVITADDKSRDYRAADPVFTYKYNGFVNNESELVLTTKPTLTTTATVNSVWGNYPIIPAGALAANYAITYKNGTLTIIPPITLPGAVLSVTNTFTPNGDGINDTWNLPALTPYPNCTVKIFDRRGTLLFNSIGYRRPWDGTYKGTYLPTGVYYYVIDSKQEAKVISGSITIIR